MAKIVLFDLDDVLIETARTRKAWISIFEKFGVDKKEANRMAREEVAGRALFRPMRPVALIKNPEARRQARLMIGRLERGKGRYNYPGAREMLARLRAGHRLVLFSFGGKAYQTRKLKQSGFGRFFSQAIITPVLGKKDALAAFRRAHPRDEILLVDDSLPAIRSAREAGIGTIWVRKGPKDREYFKKLAERIEKKLK